MSSMFITSPLHREWKAAAKARARDALSLLSESVRLAPAPSSSEPPSEEFGEVVRAVLPYINLGLNHSTFAAIVSGVTASHGVNPELFLPYRYMGGSLATGQIMLTWPREYVGLPLVCTENFPGLASWDDPDEVPMSVAPFPADSIGRVVLTGFDHVMFDPRTFSDATTLSDNDAACVHARELSRTAGTTKTFLRCFFSNFRYTGCMRVATDSEIDRLFDTEILPEHWIRSERIGLRDFFVSSQLDSSVIDHAAIETDRQHRSTASAPSAPSTTDVAAPSRYPRRSRPDDGSIAFAQTPRETARPPRRNRNIVADAESRPLMTFSGMTVPAAPPPNWHVGGLSFGTSELPPASLAPSSSPESQVEEDVERL